MAMLVARKVPDGELRLGGAGEVDLTARRFITDGKGAVVVGAFDSEPP